MERNSWIKIKNFVFLNKKNSKTAYFPSFDIQNFLNMFYLFFEEEL
jgi:hypothetical protein